MTKTLDNPDVAAVEAYLAKVPEPARSALEHLRGVIRRVAPQAEEHISYGMPAFRQGKGLIGYAAFKKHCSLFPMSGSVYTDMADEVAPWRTSKGTLQFTPDNPVPDALVKKIIEVRLAEITETAKGPT